MKLWLRQLQHSRQQERIEILQSLVLLLTLVCDCSIAEPGDDEGQYIYAGVALALGGLFYLIVRFPSISLYLADHQPLYGVVASTLVPMRSSIYW